MGAVAIKTIPSNYSTVVIKQWDGLRSIADIVQSIDMANLADVSIQVSGEFGETTKLSIAGSNDKLTYHTLSDKQGNKLVIRKPGIYSLGDNVALLTPVLDADDEKTNLIITLYARSLA